MKLNDIKVQDIEILILRIKNIPNTLSLRYWMIRNFFNGYTTYSAIKDAPWL